MGFWHIIANVWVLCYFISFLDSAFPCPAEVMKQSFLRMHGKGKLFQGRGTSKRNAVCFVGEV
jgi:hypothetical protein